MKKNTPCLVLPLPDELSDESAYQLCELLEQLRVAFESHYAGQLHRYLHDRYLTAQLPFQWITDEEEPPF